MRTSVRMLAAGVGMAVLAAFASGCSSTGSSTSAGGLSRQDATRYNYEGEVILLRGLANVFSTGLDDMNVMFRRRGVNSKVDNHSMWQAYADDIIARSQSGRVSYPIVIMGHSLGANASIEMANYLAARGVKVSYVAIFDPTVTTYPGPGVADVINYYIPNRKNGEAINVVKPGQGFGGRIVNYDVTPIGGIDHFNVEKYPQFQSQVIVRAVSLMKEKPQLVSEPGSNL